MVSEREHDDVEIIAQYRVSKRRHHSPCQTIAHPPGLPAPARHILGAAILFVLTYYFREEAASNYDGWVCSSRPRTPTRTRSRIGLTAKRVSAPTRMSS